MCEIVSATHQVQGKKKGSRGSVDVEIRCKTSGLPITITNEYGMFCAKLCNLEDNKVAKKQVDKLLGGLMSGLGFPSE